MRGNWKDAIKVRDQMQKAKGIVVEGKYYPPMLGKGFIHDRYSCSCGLTGQLPPSKGGGLRLGSIESEKRRVD